MTDLPLEREEDDRPPRATSILPLLVIVPAAAGLSRWLGGGLLVDWTTWTALVLAGAGVIGMPALFWSLDHRRTRVHQLATVGGIAGMVPLLTALASGILGRFARGGWPYAERMLAHGAPIPTVGLMPWLTFLQCALEGAVIGALSASIYWALYIAPSARRRSS